MNRLFSFFIPIYFLVVFQMLSKVGHSDVEKNNSVITESSAAAMMVTIVTGSNSPVCTGTTLDLHATPTTGDAPFTYAWTGPNLFTSNSGTPSIPNVTTAASGTYNVTVTDNGGMTATGTVSVTVNQAATANAGPDQILCKNTNAQLAGSIGGGASSAIWTASIGGGSFSPSASALNAVFDPPSGYVGNVLLTLTTNDPAGPCVAASDQVLVQYGDPDALVCNDIITVAMDEDCSVLITPDMALEGDVLDALYSVDIFTLQGQNIGNPVTSQYIGVPLKIRVKDNCTGNTCFTNMSLMDNLPPVFVNCSNITLPCAVTDYTPAYLTNVLGIAAGTPTVTDNCSGVTLTKFDTWVDIDCNQTFQGISGLSGYLKRVWTAKDASNNTSTCTQYLYFQRVSITAIQFPSDVTVDCAMMNTNPYATGVPYYEAFGQQFPLFPENSFCEVDATPTDQVVSFCDGQKSILRTWTLFDLCAGFSSTNPIVSIQVINVFDTQGPSFTCPADLTVSTNAINCCATVNLPDVIMSEGCSYVKDVIAIIITKDPFTGDTTNIQSVPGSLTSFPGNNLNNPDTLAVFPNSPCLEIGDHIVVYQAEDACGVNSTCSFTLRVVDGTPPLAACDEFTQVALGIDGMALINATTFDDGSYDNCSPVFFKARRTDVNSCQSHTQFHDQVKFCCSDIGDTIEVIMRVYDTPIIPGSVSLEYEEQHSNDCTVQVFVEDKLKPICIPPANVTVTCENFDPSLWAHGQPDAVDNCCLDTITTSVNYNNFDTICNKGTIVRTFRAYDCYGNSNQCTQRIVVTYKQAYFVKFPNDIVVNSCDGTGIYGAPTYFGEDCELLATSYEDAVYTVVPDACFKIERTWTIINWCNYNPNGTCIYVPNPNPSNTANAPANLAGPTVSEFGTSGTWAPTNVKINPTDPTATNYSQFYDPNANCYKYKQIIKIVDTQKPTIDCPASPVEFCDNSDNDVHLWNNPIFIGMNNATDLCEGNVDMCVTGTDACSGSNVSFHYLLFLDLNNDGVMESVVNSLNPPNYGTVRFNNVNTPNYNGGTSVNFDNRNVAANQKYGWTVQTTKVGNNVTACLKWNTAANPGNYVAPQLPLGSHKIKWFITDGCGNEAVCEYQFTVKDCKAPQVTCLNGLSVNIMPTGMIQMFASQFFQQATDNCTPSNLLKIGIRKSGTGMGFPVNPDGTAQTSVTFSCSELGTQLVEIWAMDLAGNADFCETYVIVQDNSGNCGQNVSVAGVVNTENGMGVEDASVQLHGTPTNGLPDLNVFNYSEPTGAYYFNQVLPVASGFSITPLKETDPLNGVNTYDLVLMSRHILGLEPLNSPYKMIAADINKSGTITTFDIVELRKLILGTYNELPSNSSWRFIDADFTFAVPDNPFADIIPEGKSMASAMSDYMDQDFVAVKIGDVDNTNTPNNFASLEERNDGTVFFTTDDIYVKAGDVVTASFRSEEKLLGYQMTLQFEDVQLLGVEPGIEQSNDNFAVFPEKNAVTSSWDGNAAPEFKVRFRSNMSGNLSDMVRVSSSITKAEGYDLTEGKMDIGLHFTSPNGTTSATGVGFELYQNQPNPFLSKTAIGFHLPEAADVKLTIFDESARVLLVKNGNYPRGYNRILIDTDKMEATTSLMYYRIETANYNSTKKMIRAK